MLCIRTVNKYFGLLGGKSVLVNLSQRMMALVSLSTHVIPVVDLIWYMLYMNWQNHK